MSLDGIDRPTIRESAPNDLERATIRDSANSPRDRPTVRETTGGSDRVDRTTRREGLAGSLVSTARRTYNLPLAILERFEYLHDLDGASGGSGAALLLCRELATDKQVVIKWYRGGEALADHRIMAVIEGADPAHIVPTTFEHADGELWEVQEYFPLGTMETLRRAARGEPFDADFVRSFVTEISEAIAYLHSVDVVHRDLKPANVFVRKEKPLPLDLVIGDFNSSIQAQETVLASVRATWAYAPPEAGSTEVSGRGDWWPVGIMTYELLVGRHPLANPATGDLPNENTIRERVFQNELDLTAVTDARWSLLVRGLLTWAEHERWNETQVRAWLAGGSPEVVKTGPGPRTGGATTARGLPGVQPFVFADTAYTEPVELIAALVASWDAATKELAGRGTERLRDFLLSTGLAPDDARKLINESSPALTLIALQRAFIDGIPLFQGHDLSQETLTAQAKAAADGDPAAGSWVSDLRSRGVLRELPRYADDSSAIARAVKRVDDCWDGIESMHLDEDARSAFAAQRGTSEGQVLLAAFDDRAGRTLRTDAVALARRGDDVIAWAQDLRDGARNIDVGDPADTSRAVLALALLPAARSLETGRLRGIQAQETAERHAAHAGLMRARRARTGRAFWLRLRITFAYAIGAGALSSVELDGVNVVQWWDWSGFWAAFVTAAIATIALSLVVFVIETWIAPLRLGGRRQLFAAGILISIALVWNEIFPASGYWQIPASTWLVPPVVMLAAFLVAQGVNALVGYRQDADEEIRGAGEPWRIPSTQRYLRAFTVLSVFALILLFIVALGFATEAATGDFAQNLILDGSPQWVRAAANAMGNALPNGAWIGYGGAGLAFTMSVAAITLALSGLQRDIGRRTPVVATLIVVAVTLLDFLIVISSPWELALALFYSAGVIVGVAVVAIIIAIIFALA